jgi:hypothetical protein
MTTMDGWYGGVYWKSVYNTIFYFSALLYIVSFFVSTDNSLILLETANILLGTGLIFEICLYGGNLGIDIQLAKYAFPFALMIGNIIYTLVLLLSNQEVISEGHVSPGYFTFINISTILVLIQLYIFLTTKKDNQINQSNRLPATSSSFIGLIGILNVICMITVYIILTYFRTDG